MNKNRLRALVAAAATVLTLGAASTAAAQRVAVGDEAPDFELESSQGESFELGSLRGDKQALLVFYRGTW